MSFSEYVRILRRFVWLIVSAALLGTGVAYAALVLPDTQYQAKFEATLAPRTDDSGTYGNLIDALDRRSIPSTFAQVVMSPSVKDTAATEGRVSRAGLSINAVVVTDSNVIEATVTGDDARRPREYAAALLKASTTSFTRLYPLYTVTALRTPTTTQTVPRHLLAGLVLGALSGALLAYLLGLAIDASRRPRARAPIASAPFARARIATDPVASRPPWKGRPSGSAKS